MTTEQLISNLITAGLFPICVEEFSTKEGTDWLTFVGNLDDFVKAAKAMETSVVFVATHQLKEEDFKHEIAAGLLDNNEDGEITDDDEELRDIDLSSVMPELERYKAYIGKDGIFKASIWAKSGPPLCLFIKEDWLLEFLELHEQAVEKIEADQESANAKQMEKQLAEMEKREKEEREMLVKLKDLVSDPEFTRLQTLRAMQTYALDKFPELAKLNPEKVKTEITTLSDLIKIKGLNRSPKTK